MFARPFPALKSIWVMCIALFLAGCASPATPAPTASFRASYSDPFAYCAATGTIDTPDARYSGPAMPDVIVQAMVKQQMVSADAPADFQRHAVWRCMDKRVWACQFGANIPCQEKADTSQVPTSALDDFCKANPVVDGVPADVTGQATVYEWNCKAGKAEPGRQLFTVDPRGYLAEFWVELTPP